jgi:hypothetical protein
MHGSGLAAEGVILSPTILVSWRGPSILRGKLLFPLSLEPKEVFKGLILFPNASDIVYFLSCLAGRTQG